jgi:uncharacterized membrane protein
VKDQSLDRHDDAPLTTSKDGDAVAKLQDRIPDQHGDSLSGITVTINRQREDLFAFWRDFSNLSSFMDNVERIDVRDRENSHWVVRAPGGKTVEWDAQVTDESDGSFIAWTSLDGADVPNSGRVDFRDATGGRGTAVTATIVYEPPLGVVGKIVAKMFQREPAIQARRDLRRFKQLMETGEIATASFTRAQAAQEKE